MVDIAQKAFDRAVRVLSRNRTTLEKGARMLLQKETLSEEDIGALAPSLVREPKEAVLSAV